MSDDIKTIYDFDYRLIREYFSSVERQGPGSPEVTLQALHFVDNLTPYIELFDSYFNARYVDYDIRAKELNAAINNLAE